MVLALNEVFVSLTFLSFLPTLCLTLLKSFPAAFFLAMALNTQHQQTLRRNGGRWSLCVRRRKTGIDSQAPRSFQGNGRFRGGQAIVGARMCTVQSTLRADPVMMIRLSAPPAGKKGATRGGGPFFQI